MNLTIFDVQTDLRTKAPVLYGRCSVQDYLSIVGERFFEFSIQRRREKFAAYSQMRDDIVAGTLLPTITLAAPLEKAKVIQDVCAERDLNSIARTLLAAAPLNILDGLQRTYILHDLALEGHTFPPAQMIHLEIRIEGDLRQLIYRIIVLNAGQKPMSMRHQIEILSLSLRDVLMKEIDGLELVPEVEGGRRTRSRKFALDRVSGAYHAFIIKSPEIEKQNVVAQRLSEQSILQQEVDQFGEQFLQFIEYFKLYCLLDDALDGIEPSSEGAPSGTNWIGSENTMNAFFAAVSDFGTDEDRRARIKVSIDRLVQSIQAERSDRQLGLGAFQEIVSGFPARKTNIGYATRKLTFTVFSEFFRKEGETSFSDFWAREAE